jgi:hypothetical protein
MDYGRSLISDLTYPFQYEMTGMLIRAPEKYEDRTFLIVTAPFQWQVGIGELCKYHSSIGLGDHRLNYNCIRRSATASQQRNKCCLR